MHAPPPAESDIRDALGRLVAGEDLRASPNLTAFLKFIVERTLEGREDTIKAYTVATEVLGRPVSFDPQLDPIVRVEATRLRRAIERHYSRFPDPVVIAIPRGSYVPQFAWASAAPAASEPQGLAGASDRLSAAGEHAPRRGGGRLGLVIAGMTAVVAVVAVVADILLGGSLATLGPPRARPPSGSPSLASLTTDATLAPGKTRSTLALTTFGAILVAPVVEGTAAGKTHAAIVTDLLRDGLARFEDVVVVEVASDQGPALPPPAEDTYLLTGRLARQGATSKVSLRLRHEASQQIVWSAEYNLAIGDAPGLSEVGLVRRVGAALAGPTGILATDQGSAKRQADPMTVPVACMLVTNAWLATGAQDKAEVSARCLERTVADWPRFPSGWAYSGRAALERYRLAANAERLTQALADARTAVDVGSQSSRAHVVLSDALAASGDAVGAMAAVDRALELNPYSVEALQAQAFRLIERGNYRDGLAIFADLTGLIGPEDPWRTLYASVAASFTQQGGAKPSPLLEPGPHPASLLGASIGRMAVGQTDSGLAAVALLERRFPQVGSDPGGVLRRLGLPDTASTALDERLKMARVPRG